MAKIIGNTTATPNPQPNWTQSDSTKADYIKNKPTVLSEDEIIGLIEEHGSDAQIQSDWNQTDTTEADFIKNKPTLGTLSEKDEVAKTDLDATLKTEIESKLDGGAVDQKINDAFNDFATELSDDGTVNTYKELIDYAATHGPEFTELVGEVDANTKAIAALDSALASYTETDPTVPKHVKDISTDDIANWNAKSTFSGSYSDLTNIPLEFKPSTHNHNFSEVTTALGYTPLDADDIKAGVTSTTTLTAGSSATATTAWDETNKKINFTFGIPKGDPGDAGNGITSINLTSSNGLVDTYTITFTDGRTTTFVVTNGADGHDGKDGVDGEDGKDGKDGRGISSIVKTSSSGLVDTYTITFTDNTQTTFTVTNGAEGQDYVLTNDDKQEIADLAVTGLAKVATSGSYNDLIDKPTIPDGTSAIAESVKTTDGDTLRFFVGTQDEYEALEDKDGLFALIEDDPNIENLNALADAVSEHEAILVDIEDELGNYLAYTLASDSNSYVCSGIGNSNSQHIVIPDIYRSLPVTKIAQSAFDGRSDIKSITISEGIEGIDAYAFRNCTNLTKVTLPKSLTYISSYAFSGCTGITSVIIPKSITGLGNGAFANCTNLTIYCEAESQPSTWNSDWNSSSCPVVWGTGSLETYGAVHALSADKATTAESADSLVLTTGTVTSTYNGTNGYYISSLVKKRFITLFFKADGACDTVVLYRPDDTCASYSTKSGRGYYCKYNVDSPYASLITFHKEDGTIITPGYINYRIL